METGKEEEEKGKERNWFKVQVELGFWLSLDMKYLGFRSIGSEASTHW